MDATFVNGEGLITIDKTINARTGYKYLHDLHLILSHYNKVRLHVQIIDCNVEYKSIINRV